MTHIGKNIKKLRKSNNMTLQELSEKTNLSIGFLSQFERGLTSIALDSLEDIAKALEVDISHFIVKPKLKESCILKSFEQEVDKIISNKFIKYNLSNVSDDKKILPKKVDILPIENKEDIKEHSHKGEEFIYVLEGTLTLLLDSKKFQLYPGDSAHYSSRKLHNLGNYTNKMVKILVITTNDEDN